METTNKENSETKTYNTIQFLNGAWIADLITEKELDTLRGVISTRGKNKGYLLANPPKDAERKAVWNAVVSYLAPARVQMWSLMFADEETNAIYSATDALLKRTGIGKALNFFEPAFRWNLVAHRYDIAKAQKILIDQLKKQRKA